MYRNAITVLFQMSLLIVSVVILHGVVDFGCLVRYRSLIAADGYQIMIRDGHLQGVVRTTDRLFRNSTTLTTLGHGVWTHIAVRVRYSGSSSSSTSTIDDAAAVLMLPQP